MTEKKKLYFKKKKVKDLDDTDYFVCNCCKDCENVEYLNYFVECKKTWLHKHKYWVFRRGRSGDNFNIIDGETMVYSLKMDRTK